MLAERDPQGPIDEVAAANAIEDAAHDAFDRGDLMEAERLLSAAAKMPAASPSVLHNLGLVRAELDDFAGAVEAYDRSVGAIADGLVNRGLCHERLGNDAAARADYLQALEANPEDVAALVNLGTMELASDDLVSATHHLRLAAELDPTANWQLSDALVAAGEVHAAERALRVAIENGELRAVSDLDDLLSTHALSRDQTDSDK